MRILTFPRLREVAMKSESSETPPKDRRYRPWLHRDDEGLGIPDDAGSLRTLDRALDLGIDMFRHSQLLH